MIQHNRLTFGLAEEQAVAEAVRSGQWAMGQRVALLEQAIARTTGVSEAVATATGLAALRLALLAVGVGAGSRVGVPAYSCVALANAILSCGGEPVPIDIRPDDWNLNPAATSAVSGLSAIIAVHTFGSPAPISELKRLRIPVVEDCAHALGIKTGATWLGGLGDVAVLSLYATKLVGGGEGGCVVSRDSAITSYVRDARDYTDKAPSRSRLNDKMTDVLAALAHSQLERLPDLLSARRALAARYDSLLTRDVVTKSRLRLPEREANRVWYRYVVELDRPIHDEFLADTRDRGVIIERPVEPWLEDLSPYPVAQRAYGHLLSLPLYPTLTHDDQDEVVRTLASVLRTN